MAGKSRTQNSAAGAAPARIAKPRTPRVTGSKHSKALAAEAAIVVPAEHKPETAEQVAEFLSEVPETHPVHTAEDPHLAISKIAYGYWESRGYAGGDPLEDWVRAEHEYRARNGNA